MSIRSGRQAGSCFGAYQMAYHVLHVVKGTSTGSCKIIANWLRTRRLRHLHWCSQTACIGNPIAVCRLPQAHPLARRPDLALHVVVGSYCCRVAEPSLTLSVLQEGVLPREVTAGFKAMSCFHFFLACPIGSWDEVQSFPSQSPTRSESGMSEAKTFQNSSKLPMSLRSSSHLFCESLPVPLSLTGCIDFSPWRSRCWACCIAWSCTTGACFPSVTSAGRSTWGRPASTVVLL